jgi:hypothetical protein
MIAKAAPPHSNSPEAQAGAAAERRATSQAKIKTIPMAEMLP